MTGDTSVQEVFSTRTFAEFDLHPSLQASLKAADFTHCTPIQEAGLDIALGGRDLLGKAQTGTGKTAAFLIAAFQHLLSHPSDSKKHRPRALVVAPTRELAMQIRDDARLLSADTGLSVLLVMGGVDIDKQQRQLEAKPCDLLIATPGRLIDLMQRRLVGLQSVRILVLDEADRLLDMGFLPDLRRIVSACPVPGKRQTLMFSATFSKLIIRLAKQWSKDMEEVSIADRPAADSVRQIVYNARSADRLPFMLSVLQEPGIRALIFANRRDTVRHLYGRLRDSLKGHCAMLAGDMAQNKRRAALERFRNGGLSALIATDVAGRGLHVEGVTHVINYDLPEDPEQYVHRIGRTGRIGASGISISFATERQAFLIPDIEAFLGEALRCEPLPKVPG